MSVLSIVATVEASNVPPRVRLVVTDTGAPAITSVTVTRLDPSGRIVAVRTEDGAPLVLQLSGSNRVGTVYDYEMPYGQAVTYSTESQPAVASNAVTVDEDRIWLIHPGVPSLSQPITLMRGSLDEELDDVNIGVFYPMGRSKAVSISDGRRKAPQSQLVVGTETPAERQALRDLLADVFPLLLNVPPLSGLDLDTDYIQIGPVRRQRPSDIGFDPVRNFVLPYWVVEMPVGGSQSQRTWADVIAENATWQDVIDTYDTWADVLAPTT